jgi:type I site-specific restriction endonuclease
MPRNESQTRFELIDPAVADRRWDRRTDIRVEETAKPIDIVNHQPRERAAGRTDYVLRSPLTPGAEPVPLAIVEAEGQEADASLFRLRDLVGPQHTK